jgi:hypothetical protein
MHNRSGAEQLGTIPASQLSTIAGGSLWAGLPPFHSGSPRTPPAPSHIWTLPFSPRRDPDPGITPRSVPWRTSDCMPVPRFIPAHGYGV